MRNKIKLSSMRNAILYTAIIILGFCSKLYSQTIQEPQEEEINYSKQLGIAFGGGTLSYFGDLNKNSNVGMSSQVRYGLNVGIEDRINNYFGIQFNGLFGKLSYNERSKGTFRNFETNLIQGNFDLVFYFDDNSLLKTSTLLSPYLFAGVGFLSFSPKGDLKDANGNQYYYWDDGSIKNKAQDAPDNKSAIAIKRDYNYETSYKGSGALVFPLGAGLKVKLSRSLETNIFATYNISLADKIDNLEESGNNDKYLYTAINLSYNIGQHKKEKTTEKQGDDAYNNIDFASIDKLDSDKDGIADLLDLCANTPLNIPVDIKGCPIDGDNDGVPDYLDKEPQSIKGAIVGSDGITLTDSMIVEKMKRDSMAVSRNDLFNQNPTLLTLREMEEKGMKNKKPSTGSGFINSPEFKIADANKDGYLSVDEIMSGIDLFFEGETELNVEKINKLIDYFFEQ